MREEEKETAKELTMDLEKLNKWQKRFIREFVNDHGNAWRPLRGLWVEDVLEFIQKEIDSALSSQLKEVVGVIESKKKKLELPQIKMIKGMNPDYLPHVVASAQEQIVDDSNKALDDLKVEVEKLV